MSASDSENHALFNGELQLTSEEVGSVDQDASYSNTIVPLSEFDRPMVGARLFDAVLPPNNPDTTFFSENTVPMDSVVLNVDADYDGDATSPGYIARAALQVNPDISFVVPTRVEYDSEKDPRFIAERERIAVQLGVPVQNVAPVRTPIASWPQDEFLAGNAGLIKPLEPDATGFPETYVGNAKRTLFGPNDLAAELGLPVAGSAAIARGGDTHVITRPDGQQAAYFSGETVNYTARTHGFEINTPADRLRAISIAMTSMEDAGVPLENIMPIGRPDSSGPQTYGEVLDQLTEEERGNISPAALDRFHDMRNLPFPETSYAYHTDVMSFTPDGLHMFIREYHADDLALKQQLEFFGYEPVALPSGLIMNSEEAREAGDVGDKVYIDEDSKQGQFGYLQLNYSNMVQGLTPDGRTAILMPTEAMDPEQLTERDRIALARIQASLPDAVVVPIGGRSAVTGEGSYSDGTVIDKDYGAHCMSNVLPYEIRPRARDQHLIDFLRTSSWSPAS